MSAKPISTLKRSRKELHCEERDEIAFWKNNYNEMKRLKEQAEEDLQTEKKLRVDNGNILKEGLDILKQTQESAETDVGADLCCSKSSVEISNSERIINFYERMTAMTVKIKENEKFCCTIKNAATRQAAQFFISPSPEEGEMLYEPSANAALFPEYMNDEALSFIPEMGPVLLGDAIASLFVDENSDGEDSVDDDDA